MEFVSAPVCDIAASSWSEDISQILLYPTLLMDFLYLSIGNEAQAASTEKELQSEAFSPLLEKIRTKSFFALRRKFIFIFSAANCYYFVLLIV